ncbi:PAZ domain-containing protein [Allorhizobium undicola]|uniref:hypothetical protein n=1 Tax=Allorhizobium undicola TaxID=78527 RepID=UPI00146FB30A|nr:hypothetical protein [Allorhizobium undicola]
MLHSIGKNQIEKYEQCHQPVKHSLRHGVTGYGNRIHLFALCQEKQTTFPHDKSRILQGKIRLSILTKYNNRIQSISKGKPVSTFPEITCESA